MYRRLVISSLVLLGVFSLAASLSQGAEKLRYATPAKGTPSYEIPVVAAVDKGFFRLNDIVVDWIPFRGGADLLMAVAAGHLDLGTVETISLLLGTSRGTPLLAVASLMPAEYYFVWVRADGPIKEIKDLKGAKIGVVGLHDVTGSYARVLSKALGLDVKLVALGGTRERVAALKAGRVDGTVGGLGTAVMLKLKGEIREVIYLKDYLPQPWGQHLVFARKEIAGKNPALVKKGVKAMMQAADFIGNNPTWTMETMKARYGYNDAAAKLVYGLYYQGMQGSGRIEPKGFENVKNFLLEYGLLSKDKVPTPEELYSEKFLP